jgi:hypothetical protein
MDRFEVFSKISFFDKVALAPKKGSGLNPDLRIGVWIQDDAMAAVDVKVEKHKN